MSLGKLKFFLPLLLVFLLFAAIALGVLLSKGGSSAPSSSETNQISFNASNNAVSAKVGNEIYEIDSRSNQLNIDKGSFKEGQFSSLVSELGIGSDSHLLTMELKNGLKVLDGIKREVSPEKVRVVFDTISSYQTQLQNNDEFFQGNILTESDAQGNPAVIYFGAETSVDRSIVQTTIYVNPLFISSNSEPQELVSKMILKSLLINLGGFGVDALDDELDAIYSSVDEVQPEFIRLQVSLATVLLNKFYKLLNLPIANAGTCSGSVTCGSWQRQNGICDAGNNSCLDDDDCTLPGDTCVGARNVCEASGGGSCFCSGADCGVAGGSSYVCLHTCTCLVSGSCSRNDGGGAPPPPPACGDGRQDAGEDCTTCCTDTPGGCSTCPGGGGGGGPPPPPPPPPPDGSCGSCSGCYAPDPDPGPNYCARLSGVCSKAGFCPGGGWGTQVM